MKKISAFFIALALFCTASYARCEDTQKDIQDKALPIAFLIRLGMAWGLSYANAPHIGGPVYSGRPPFRSAGQCR